MLEAIPHAITLELHSPAAVPTSSQAVKAIDLKFRRAYNDLVLIFPEFEAHCLLLAIRKASGFNLSVFISSRIQRGIEPRPDQVNVLSFLLR